MGRTDVRPAPRAPRAKAIAAHLPAVASMARSIARTSPPQGPTTAARASMDPQRTKRSRAARAASRFCAPGFKAPVSQGRIRKVGMASAIPSKTSPEVDTGIGMDSVGPFGPATQASMHAVPSPTAVRPTSTTMAFASRLRASGQSQTKVHTSNPAAMTPNRAGPAAGKPGQNKRTLSCRRLAICRISTGRPVHCPNNTPAMTSPASQPPAAPRRASNFTSEPPPSPRVSRSDACSKAPKSTVPTSSTPSELQPGAAPSFAMDPKPKV